MGLYDDMAVMARGMLAEYAQGTVEIGRPVATAGAETWDAPSVVTDYVEANAVVRGVSKAFVDGVTVLMTDLQVITYMPDDYTPMPGDLMKVDGGDVAIIRQEQIPGAGTIACWRFIVRR